MTYSNSNSNSRSRGTTVMSLTRYTIGQVQTAIVESATSSPLAILKLKTEKTKCNLSLSQEQINNNNHGNAKVAKQLNQNKCTEKPFENKKENYE